jgi:hypothetical protein
MARSRQLVTFLLITGILGITLSSQAHHSVSGRYDMNKETTLTGTITRVDWVNPHIRIYVDVPDDEGNITKWNLTGLTPGFMRQMGLKKRDVMGDGKPVQIFGITSYNSSLNDMWVYRITYSDGHFYQMATNQVK